MIELQRIILVDWYLFRAEQIDVGGMTALIGPNGAGKSAIIDAAQTVLTGANMSSIRFNASAQAATKSKRSIRDYCLGVVSLDEKGERSQPTRDHAYTYVVLGFVDRDSGDAFNLGIVFSASSGRSEENCEARFLARGSLISIDDLLEPIVGDEVETRHWPSVRTLLRARDFEVDDGFGSGGEFVAEALRSLSPPGFPLDPRRFIRAFRNALMLKPVDNPTDFVRNYVLDVQPIRVDRLRRSIDLYRSLTARIKDLKAQSASLEQIIKTVTRTNENERIIRVTEWQIARLLWEYFSREVRKYQKKLKEVRAELAEMKRAAEEAEAFLSVCEADVARAELAINNTQPALLIRTYESDRKAALGERASATSPLIDIDDLLEKIDTAARRRIIIGHDDALHALLESVVEAKGASDLRRWTVDLPEDWQRLAEGLDAVLASVTTERLTGAQRVISDRFVAMHADVQATQKRIDDIDGNLKRLAEGRSPIEPGTSALITALHAQGIAAEPICDIVEVSAEKWRVAAEAALGRSREALIVEPGDAAQALKIYRGGHEETFRNAEVVNTTKTKETRPAQQGSLATVIATKNNHARAFLDFRLGRLAMVETEDQVLASESAITPDRMMHAARTVKRLRHPEYLKLGRASAEETRKILETQRRELERLLGEKVGTALRAKEDSELIDAVVRHAKALRSKGVTVSEVGKTLAELDRKVAGLEADIAKAKDRQDPKMLEELGRLKIRQANAKEAKQEADRQYHAQELDERTIATQYEDLTKRDSTRLRIERRRTARASAKDRGTDPEVGRFQVSIRSQDHGQLEEDARRRKSELQRRVDRRPALQRDLSAALSRHVQDFRIAFPFAESDANVEVVAPWAEAEKMRLDQHELVQYEDQCRNAEGEMITAFRDDLLHKLHDAFEGIKETISELNRHLKDRQFHGRDYYSFRSMETASHADMIELVRRSQRPDFNLPLFASDPDPDADTAAIRAVKQIEQILSQADVKTDEIEDPRQYFNFELYIQDRDGKIRSSLTSRAGTGSGGEGQLPFYIAIGASLAATYQNKRTGVMGLALAVFDEAFNRLDTRAISACSEFLSELGLQVVLAAPDEKRHVFMEIVDTVVNVNRSGDQVLVYTEYPTAKTRETLSDADPYRKGFDAFREELVAKNSSENAKAGGSKEAAE